MKIEIDFDSDLFGTGASGDFVVITGHDGDLHNRKVISKMMYNVGVLAYEIDSMTKEFLIYKLDKVKEGYTVRKLVESTELGLDIDL